MVELTPEQIYNNYKNGKLTKSAAFDLLQAIIENEENRIIKIAALEFLEEMDIKSIEIFNFLENLVVSDRDFRIREKSALMVIKHFPNDAYELIKWVLTNEDSLICLGSIKKAIAGSSEDSLKPLMNMIEHVVYDNKIYLVQNSNLILRDLGITDISDIERFDKIEKVGYLDLSHNKIKKIKSLKNLKYLRALTFDHNQITEIEGLEALENLNFLSLSYNNISEIKGLEKLKSLYHLDLDNNQISEIKGLENLFYLDYLNLGYNELTKIQGLEKNVKLQHLCLENNKIQKVEGIEHLEKLQTFRIYNNEIEEE